MHLTRNHYNRNRLCIDNSETQFSNQCFFIILEILSTCRIFYFVFNVKLVNLLYSIEIVWKSENYKKYFFIVLFQKWTFYLPENSMQVKWAINIQLTFYNKGKELKVSTNQYSLNIEYKKRKIIIMQVGFFLES